MQSDDPDELLRQLIRPRDEDDVQATLKRIHNWAAANLSGPVEPSPEAVTRINRKFGNMPKNDKEAARLYRLSQAQEIIFRARRDGFISPEEMEPW